MYFMDEIADHFGLVISYFDLEDYELMIIQDENGELITLKIGYDRGREEGR